MNKNPVIVTGAGGFLGSHICRHFASKGHKVIPFGRSLAQNTILSQLKFESVFDEELPSKNFEYLLKNTESPTIIHAAGTSSVQYSLFNPFRDFDQTVNTFAFVINSVREFSPDSRVILLSSAAVYGSPTSLPITERSACKPISSYGYHKLMCEMLAEEYSSLFNINTLVLRIFSAYGNGLTRQVLYDFCMKFLTQNEVIVHGTGEERRDFIHVLDIVRAIEILLRNESTGIFNVASGTSISIGKLACMIKEYLRIDKEILFTGDVRKGDPVIWEADVSKLKSAGFQPKIEISEGVQLYCDWLLRNGGHWQ